MDDAIRILTKLQEIAEKASSAAEYRAMISESAAAGDLDPSTDRFKQANERARDFIRGND